MKDFSKRKWISEDTFYKAVLRETRRGKGVNLYQVGDFEVMFGSLYTYAKSFNDPDCCFRFSRTWTQEDVWSYLEGFYELGEH